jgi:hypothetical protein
MTDISYYINGRYMSTIYFTISRAWEIQDALSISGGHVLESSCEW